MKKKFMQYSLVALSLSAPLSADSIDDYIAGQISGGFPGVVDLFQRLESTSQALEDTKASFVRQLPLFSDFASEFLNRKNLRESTFNCILSKFHAYQAAIIECAANKENVTTLIDLDKRILAGQIFDLQSCTQQEINHLNTDITEIQTNINNIKLDYATLKNMSEENVNAAITKLTTIQDEYAAMVTIRTNFISELDSLLDALKQSESLEKDETISIQNEICNS